MLINDVTLREGDQMPRRNYNVEDKITAGKTLDRLGLPVIQPGFPATGEKDRRVIAELAGSIDAKVSGLARARASDIDAALDADADVIDVFIPISEILRPYMLGKSHEETLNLLGKAIDQVRDGGATPHITLADAFRADVTPVVDVFESFSDVPYITLADTVGARTPSTVTAYLNDLTTEIDLVRTGVHFHDDLGVATANTLAAYRAGVGKIDVSIASLGERAGNACLEEVIVAATVEHDDTLGVDESALIPVCREVLGILGEDVDLRKPVLGEEVTQHEAGLHTEVMLENPSTFEPYDPLRFGGERRLLFGSQTGRGGAQKILEKACIEPTNERIGIFREALTESEPLELDEAITLAQKMFDT